MRDTFVRTLVELAKEDKNIELLTGDLGFGVLKPFWETVPDQFTDAGIAEQNMTTVAAGMALEGKTVFTYSIGNFPTLGLVYGSLGMSHHATEDLAVMRALPDMVVMAPGDPAEAEAATRAIAAYPGTCYLRLGRGGERRIHESITDYQIGRALQIRDSRQEGMNITVFSSGAILDEVCDACSFLEQKDVGILQYSFPTVKPIDPEAVIKCAKDTDAVFTVEEHNITGGFGSAVAEVMAEVACGTPLYRIGLNDEYCTKVGSQQYLRNEYGLSAEKIAEYILDKMNR